MNYTRILYGTLLATSFYCSTALSTENGWGYFQPPSMQSSEQGVDQSFLPQEEVQTPPTAWSSHTSTTEVYLSADDLEVMIEEALKRQDWPLAIHYSQTLETLNGANGMALYARSLAFIQQGEYTQAIQPLQTLIDERSNYSSTADERLGEVYLQLAEIAVYKGDNTTAQKYLDQLSQYQGGFGRNPRISRLYEALQNQTDPDAQKRYIRVGALLPLSGNYAKVGEDLQKALQLAAFEHTGEQILLYPVDAGDSAEQAASAAQQLEKMGVEVIIGPLLSPQVDAVQNTINTRHTPVLALSSDPHVAGKGVHLMSFRPDDQARIIARHAISQGRSRIAALVPATPYGYEVFDAFRDEVSALGGQLIATSFYNPANADLSAPLETLLQLDLARKNMAEELKELEAEFEEFGNALPDEKLARIKYLKTAKPEAVLDFDALFVPTTDKNLPLVTAQLALYDVDQQDVVLLGTAAWQGKELRKGAEYIQKGWYPSIPDATLFTQNYKQEYGETPGKLAVLGYDAFRIITQSLQQPGGLKQALLRPEGFISASGGLRFHPNGKTERGFNITEISGRKSFHVKQASILLPPPLPSPLNPGKRQNFWGNQPWN